jgi:hypothetical protein
LAQPGNAVSAKSAATNAARLHVPLALATRSP